ncbi:hypothetical protein SLS60_004207 [Paraconiothyrium brasiliense]|uniref:INO80 complex subunit B-like conserved region domain-containing protein n=1 Tax=Paraconiothyrium brasiliense TaxID=300254 RepID=A0ABR3RQT8_9PLEO
MPRLRSRASLTAPSAPAPTASSSRPRRNTVNKAPPAAVIQRSSPEESRQSLNLTVKASPGRLREATGVRASTAVNSRNIITGKRARNSRVVREVDSDDEEDEDEAEEVDAMDVDEDEEDAEGEEDEDMDAEGEEDDDADVTSTPRIVVPSNKSVPVKQKIAQDSVEAKEMALDDDDDEELSELDSELEGDDEDAEGEDDDAEGEEDDEIAVPNDDDEEMDSDEDLSRDQTPDLSKMTRRQQAMVVQGADESLMALSNEAQKKKHLTAEEITSRRAEMARRRKNLSEKRNEEEKADTINRLLKKQPPKRGRKSMLAENTEDGQEEEDKRPEKANPLFVRYKQTTQGTTLAIPEEWLQAPAGSLFSGTVAKPISKSWSGRMVEEVS